MSQQKANRERRKMLADKKRQIERELALAEIEQELAEAEEAVEAGDQSQEDLPEEDEDPPPLVVAPRHNRSSSAMSTTLVLLVPLTTASSRPDTDELSASEEEEDVAEHRGRQSLRPAVVSKAVAITALRELPRADGEQELVTTSVQKRPSKRSENESRPCRSKCKFFV